MLDSLNIWQYAGSPSRPNGLPLGRIGNPCSMDHPKKTVLCLVGWTSREYKEENNSDKWKPGWCGFDEHIFQMG